jgi:hypothetical protein
LNDKLGKMQALVRLLSVLELARALPPSVQWLAHAALESVEMAIALRAEIQKVRLVLDVDLLRFGFGFSFGFGFGFDFFHFICLRLDMDHFHLHFFLFFSVCSLSHFQLDAQSLVIVQNLFHYLQQCRDQQQQPAHQDYFDLSSSDASLAREGENTLAAILTSAWPILDARLFNGSVALTSLLESTTTSTTTTISVQPTTAKMTTKSSSPPSNVFSPETLASFALSPSSLSSASNASSPERSMERVFERLSMIGDLIPAMVCVIFVCSV